MSCPSDNSHSPSAAASCVPLSPITDNAKAFPLCGFGYSWILLQQWTVFRRILRKSRCLWNSIRHYSKSAEKTIYRMVQYEIDSPSKINCYVLSLQKLIVLYSIYFCTVAVFRSFSAAFALNFPSRKRPGEEFLAQRVPAGCFRYLSDLDRFLHFTELQRGDCLCVTYWHSILFLVWGRRCGMRGPAKAGTATKVMTVIGIWEMVIPPLCLFSGQGFACA